MTPIMTSEGEQEFGVKMAKEVERTMGLYDAPKLVAYVKKLGRRLSEHSPRQDVSYAFHVVDMVEPNAFALPGGYIYVSRGLLALVNDEEELAGVLAHEIAHVASRHHAKSTGMRAIWRLLRDYAWRYRWSYLTGGAFLWITNLLAVSIPGEIGQAIDALIKKNDLEVPESLIQRYLENVVTDYRQQAGDQPIDEEAIRQQYRGLAMMQMQWQLIQAKIGEQEEIEVSEDALRERVTAWAEGNGMDGGEAWNALAQQGRLDSIRADMREEQIIELILDGGPCPGGIPSTVLNLTTDPPTILRSGAIAEEDIKDILLFSGDRAGSRGPG